MLLPERARDPVRFVPVRHRVSDDARPVPVPDSHLAGPVLRVQRAHRAVSVRTLLPGGHDCYELLVVEKERRQRFQRRFASTRVIDHSAKTDVRPNLRKTITYAPHWQEGSCGRFWEQKKF